MTILNSKSASASWYQGSWTYREKLTVNHTKVSGTSDLANFPILITITDVNVKNNALSNGNDILFTSSDGTTKLNHEIEKYDSSTGSLQAWVSVPKLSPNKDTDIYIYYGNSGASDQSNKTGVWSGSGYQNVWHLSEDPSGSAPQVKDSTSDANNGTSAGSMASNQQVAGQVDGSLNFDGANDEIDLDGTKGEILATSPITLEAWFYADSDHSHNSYPEQNQYARLIARKSDYGSTNTYTLSPNLDSNNVSIGFWDQTLTSTGTYTLDAWHHVVGTYDGSGNWSIYLDGNLNNSQSSVTPTTGSRTNVNFRLGAETTGISLLDGKLDEVRVSTSAKSAGWVKTEFNNQSSPSTFLTSSSLETQGPVLYLAFNEGQGLTANDSSGQTNTGTLAGSTKPTWQTEDLCVTGKCLYFEGSSASVTVANTISLVKTVSFWVKPKTNGEYLMDLDDGTHYISASAGTITATGFSSPTYYVNGIQTRTLTANTWNYIEITTATGISASAIKVGDAYFSSTHHYLNGFVDDVKMYDYVRSASQVKTDFASRGSVKGVSAQMGGTDQAYLSKGLVGYWKMDESSGNATDSSGNSLTLTNNSVMVYGAGKFGNAVTGDGTADYLNTATAINGIKTVSFWAYTPDTTNYFVNLINSSAYITSTTGTITATGFTTPSIYVNGTLNGTISANTWTHVVITTDTAINANAFAVGLTNDGSNHFYTNTSKIDEVRTYNRALSPKEVSDLYNWAPGPVGYWKMDDKVKGASQTIVDTSGNANNGTTAGTNIDCSNDPGKYGGACTLNGTDDYISMGNPSNLTNLAQNGDFTVEAWVKNTGTSTYANIINKDNNGTNGWHLMTGTNNYVEFKVGYSTTDLNKANNGATSSLTPNVWHHLVAVFKQSLNRGYVFVDGAELTYAAWGNADGVGTIDSDSTRNLEIGRQNNTSTNLLKGPIDEVKIYNYARTQKQIVSDMNAGHPAVGSPVGSSVAYWKFDAGQGTSANDSTPNANTLTLSSASWINSGKFGKAWNGDGTKWLSRADDADFDVTDTDDYAISLWFKSDAAANPVATEYLIDKGPVKASSAGYAIYAQTDGTICFGIDDDTTWDPDVASCSPTSLYDSAWHHLVAIRDHTGTDKILVYIDGILKDSDLDTTTATLANAQILYLGDSNGADAGDEFNGDLDEVKVYRYALTTDEIKTEYNRGQSIQMGALGNNSSYQPQAANQEYCVPGDASSCAAPVGRWDFEEGKDNTCNGGSNDICDISTSGKDGTHGAGVTWTTGKYGKGMYFAASGVANNIPLGDNFDITGTDNMTWEVWFKTDGQNRSNRRGIGGKKSSEGSNTAGYWMDINTSGIAEALISNATAQITLTSIATVDDSKWHHLVVLINRTTGNSQMYIDGNLNDTDTTPTGDLSNALGYVYGSISLNSAVFPYKGKLDQAMIFNYVRSAAQIAWDYNRGAPVAQWKFDECSGLVAHDSISTNNGTITIGTGAGTGHQDSAGTCTTSAATAWYNGATGKRNASLNLDGIDDYISVPYNNIFDLTKFTLSGWFNISNTGAGRKYFMEKNNNFYVWFDPTGEINSTGVAQIVYGFYGGGYQDSTYTFSPTTSTWYHFAVTYDQTAIKLYINGVLVKSTNQTNVPTTGSSTINIGTNTSPQYFFPGKLDDFKVHNYALTATQIKTELNNGAIFFGPTTGSP